MRLFWDIDVTQTDVNELINEKLKTIDHIGSQQFFSRLLTSCDWYTLIKLLPPMQLSTILNDEILDRLYPTELKGSYTYAREVLSRQAVSASG